MKIELLDQPIALDPRPFSRRIGLITLATDHTIEPDLNTMLAGFGIGVYGTRVAYGPPITPETLRAMEPRLAAAASLILPGEDLDAIIYGCTSASVIIGDEAVSAQIQTAKPGVPVITPIAAVVRGLRAMQARRISVLTPYTRETSAPMADYLTASGFEIDRFTCLGMLSGPDIARIPLSTILDLAVAAIAPGSEALFISCTAMRAAGIIDRLEARIGRPVVCSNYAAAWNALRVCGISDAPVPGRLMTCDLPTAAIS